MSPSEAQQALEGAWQALDKAWEHMDNLRQEASFSAPLQDFAANLNSAIGQLRTRVRTRMERMDLALLQAEIDRQVEAGALTPVQHRLLALLHELALPPAAGAPALPRKVAPNLPVIAGQLGVKRDTLRRLMSELAKLGYLRRHVEAPGWWWVVKALPAAPVEKK